MPLSFPEIFPDEDYRFHLTLRRGDLAAFFASSNPAALTERANWLRQAPEHYVSADSHAQSLVTELEAMARQWTAGEFSAETGRSIRERLTRLGERLEPDLILLSPDQDGAFRVRAGVVCFPSSWALTEKIGLTLDETHGVVPGLNSDLGGSISQFLRKLKPETAYERANWGLAATPELNLHPALRRPRLAPPCEPARVWVRIEDQILAIMPETGGVLFGIRIRVHPLCELLEEPRIKAGLHRALRTMPTPLAAYKGLGAVHADLLALTVDRG